uniref:ATP binding cassette subfamily B member 8 n=1 Tax=Monodon monoceros TaxID=40151 RepID=A0A8C6BEW3_MONMO
MTWSRDGRPSSCLLGAVARLQPQLRAGLPRAPAAPGRSPSAWLWVGGVLLGPVILSKCPRRGLVALCEAEAAPPARSGPGAMEPRFNWKLFCQFLRPHLLVLGAAVVLALGTALVNVQIPLLLGQLVEIVAKYTRDHVGSFLTESRNLSTHLLILYGLQGLLTFGYLVLLSRIGERMAADMRRALFSNLLRQDIAFFDAKKTGQLVSRLTTDVQEFKSSFKLVISQGLRSFTQVAGCLVSLSMLSTRLTLLLMVATPALMGAGTLMGSALRKLSRQCQEQVARATGVADEALGNVRTVRAFAMEQREEERYGAELGGSRSKAEELGRGIALFQGLSSIAFNCMVLGTLFIGGSLVAGQQLTGGDLMSFLVASQTVQRSMANLSVLFGQVVRGLSAGTRVFEYMTLSPCIPLSGGHCIPREHLRGSITFHNVCFSYPCRPGFQVLRDFTLTLPPGKIVALVGQSGGGKTTVASLLERFYDPTAGMVTLDGQDLRTLDPSWLRGQVIGFISQVPASLRGLGPSPFPAPSPAALLGALGASWLSSPVPSIHWSPSDCSFALGTLFLDVKGPSRWKWGGRFRIPGFCAGHPHGVAGHCWWLTHQARPHSPALKLSAPLLSQRGSTSPHPPRVDRGRPFGRRKPNCKTLPYPSPQRGGTLPGQLALLSQPRSRSLSRGAPCHAGARLLPPLMDLSVFDL